MPFNRNKGKERSIVNLTLTHRDSQLLVALTHRVKALSLAQVQGAWWPDATAATCRARLDRLCQEGWIRAVSVLTRRISFLAKAPLLIQVANGAEPCWADVLRTSRKRWCAPVSVIRAWVAASRASRVLAGHARYPRPSEGTHDLFLAAVFLERLRRTPGEAERWVGEGGLAVQNAGNEHVLPDALIRNPDHSIAIEVVGESYTAAKLHSFHDFCGRKGWAYELW